MAYDDRYGDRDRNRRGEPDRNRGDWDRDRSSGGDDRGFFGRAGEEVRSWFGGDDRDQGGREQGGREQSGQGYGQNERGSRDYDRGYGRDPQDRNPGAHTNYYSGGDRGQRRMGPEGGFEDRGDYRRTERYSEQGQSRGGGGERGGQGGQERDTGRNFGERGHGGSSSSFSGSGGVNQGMGSYGGQGGSGYAGGTDDSASWSTGGGAGPGYAPEFSGGPRFDRADVGSVGTHGAHPVASPYGEAQTGAGTSGSGGMGGGMGGVGSSSARSRAILQQYERQHGQGGQQGQDPQQAQGGQQGQGYQQAQGGQQDWQREQGSGTRGQGQHDPHYSEWRRRQIEEIDRDYDEYRRENASRFESEFGSWRQKRGQQRQSLGRATEHMEVVGSDGQHVGTVDKVAGDRIILTKSDPNAGGHHHSIPCSWIEKVEDKVIISKTADEAMQAWRDEETSRALFERPDSGSEGPHALERSFSGTYKGDDDR